MENLWHLCPIVVSISPHLSVIHFILERDTSQITKICRYIGLTAENSGVLGRRVSWIPTLLKPWLPLPHPTITAMPRLNIFTISAEISNQQLFQVCQFEGWKLEGVRSFELRAGSLPYISESPSNHIYVPQLPPCQFISSVPHILVCSKFLNTDSPVGINQIRREHSIEAT